MLQKKEANNFIGEFKSRHPALKDTSIVTVMYKESLGPDYVDAPKFKGGYLPKDNAIMIIISEHKDLKDLETTLKHETYEGIGVG